MSLLLNLGGLSLDLGGSGGGSQGEYHWNYRGDYDNGISYNTDDVVFYNGGLWHCFNSANLSAGYPPDSRPECWIQVSSVGDNPFDQTLYTTDYVTFGGAYFPNARAGFDSYGAYFGDGAATIDASGNANFAGVTVGGLPISGGNPFDQSLNTTDTPTFAGIDFGNGVGFDQYGMSATGTPVQMLAQNWSLGSNGDAGFNGDLVVSGASSFADNSASIDASGNAAFAGLTVGGSSLVDLIGTISNPFNQSLNRTDYVQFGSLITGGWIFNNGDYQSWGNIGLGPQSDYGQYTIELNSDGSARFGSARFGFIGESNETFDSWGNLTVPGLSVGVGQADYATNSFLVSGDGVLSVGATVGGPGSNGSDVTAKTKLLPDGSGYFANGAAAINSSGAAVFTDPNSGIIQINGEPWVSGRAIKLNGDGSATFGTDKIILGVDGEASFANGVVGIDSYGYLSSTAGITAPNVSFGPANYQSCGISSSADGTNPQLVMAEATSLGLPNGGAINSDGSVTIPSAAVGVLSCGNPVSSSTDSTVDSKVEIVINGTTYYLLASTSAS